METKIGIITNVMPKFKKNGKDIYLNIELADGFKVNNFNAMPGDFEVGETVEYTGETPEGSKYWNLASMSKSDGEVPVVKPGELIQTKAGVNLAKTNEYHLSIEEVRCRALEIATTWKNNESMAIYETAAMIEKWILRQ